MVDLTEKVQREILILAVLYAAVPFLSMALAAFFLGEAQELNWWVPAFWMLFSFLSAGLILIRRKWSWLVANILSFGIVCMLLIGSWLYHHELILETRYRVLFALASLICILMTGRFYRYPYLDRRDHLLSGVATRHRVAMAASVNEKIFGEIVSASKTGVLFKTSAEIHSGKNEGFSLSIKELNLHDVPVEIVGSSNDLHKIKFLNVNFFKKLKLGNILKRYPQEENPQDGGRKHVVK